MFSVGVLYSTQEFMQLVQSQRISVSEFRQSFPKYNHIRCDDVLNVAFASKWVDIATEGNSLQLTSSGREIVLESDSAARLRLQLRDMLRFSPPSWMGLVYRGRSSVRHYANLDTVQCFQDAGLLSDADPCVASWWDEVASPSRLQREERLLQIGRRGEWLSVEYEERRVGRRPRWISLDNAEAGYDLISLVKRHSDDTLVIEVKASEEPWETAQFHLSRNEWLVLSSHRHAVIHLWCLASRFPLYSEIDIDTLTKHIPDDLGVGKWESVRIPFDIAGSGLHSRSM